MKPARISADVLRGALQAQEAIGSRGGDVPHFAALSPACREYSDRARLPLFGGHGFQSAFYALWWAPRARRRASIDLGGLLLVSGRLGLP